MNRNVRLFLALIRHARADLSQKPLLEFRAGFEDTTSHDQSIGVESIYHFIEKLPARELEPEKSLCTCPAAGTRVGRQRRSTGGEDRLRVSIA
jgi:hypothetical protein